MMAMRHYKRSQTVEGVTDTRSHWKRWASALSRSKRCIAILAIANHEDRFVIPHQPSRTGGGCLPGTQRLRLYLRRWLPPGQIREFNLFNSRRIDAIDVSGVRKHGEASDADPESDRSAAGVPRDELLWENRDDALALIRADVRFPDAVCR